MENTELMQLVDRILLDLCGQEAGVDDFLVDNGLNSLKLLQFISIIEKKLQFSFDNDDLRDELFATKRSILTLLECKIQPK